MQELIQRALEKDRDLRYQHAADIRAELQRLKRDTDRAGRAGGEETESTLRPPQPVFLGQEEERKTWQTSSSAVRVSKTIESLAVLPFENVSGDPEHEYLSDGITGSLINILARVPKLRVMARSTVFRYKDHED